MERAKDGMLFDRQEDRAMIEMMVQGTLQHAQDALLEKITIEQLRKTATDLWLTLHAMPATGVMEDGGDVCPGLGVDVAILKDPAFAGRFQESGGLPNGGSGEFDLDVLQTMADAFCNYLEKAKELVWSADFGRPGEKSIVVLFQPKDRKTVFDFLETVSGGKELVAKAMAKAAAEAA